ncbi:hypothetical protein NL108_003605 [Boleophthalmus pectinirostris]|nr:hypothetical protein NL108_003605 [Boleophthalmus pectinirostris]
MSKMSIHPCSSAYLGSGRGGISLSRDSQTSLTPDTSSSSSGGDPEVFPGQSTDIVPRACPGSSHLNWLLSTWRSSGSTPSSSRVTELLTLSLKVSKMFVFHMNFAQEEVV